MNLKKATLFSIIGISYIFLSRTIATFFPGIFTDLMVTRINTLVSLLASLAIFVFYIYFYEDYVQEKQLTLKNASLFAIIGSFAGVLLFLKGILVVFDLYVSRFQFLNIFAPWLNSTFLLYFFIVFYKEALHNVQSNLRLAILLAIIGSSISTLVRTIMAFNYFYSGKFKWLWDYSGESPVVIVPMFAFVFFTSFYFFLTFYKEQ